MKILIDTHIFLWLLLEPKKISQNQVTILQNPEHHFYLSAISITELMIKASIGKLELNFDPIQAASNSGLILLPYEAQDALILEKLPFYHKDPFDRMLIAQAQTRNMQIMSSDQYFKQYGDVID